MVLDSPAEQHWSVACVECGRCPAGPASCVPPCYSRVTARPGSLGRVRSIELVLSPASDAAVRAAWDELIADGLPSLGRHVSESNAPHVTLTAGQDLVCPVGFDAPVPTVLRVGGVLLFPAGTERSVLVRAVVLDPALAAFHAAVHRAAPGGVDTALPGSWSPHLTLARRVRDVDLPRAVVALRRAPLPDVLEVGGVRFWDGETGTVTPLG